MLSKSGNNTKYKGKAARRVQYSKKLLELQYFYMPKWNLSLKIEQSQSSDGERSFQTCC